MSKKQNRLTTFFLYLKLLKKWGFKQKNKFIIANIFMLIVAIAKSIINGYIEVAIATINIKIFALINLFFCAKPHFFKSFKYNKNVDNLFCFFDIVIIYYFFNYLKT